MLIKLSVEEIEMHKITLPSNSEAGRALAGSINSLECLLISLLLYFNKTFVQGADSGSEPIFERRFG